MKFDMTITISDIIAVFGVIVGIWIAWVVQNRLSTGQAIKNYHIDELKNIRDLYSAFINDVITSNKSATEIKDWLKVMSSRINSFEESINDYYNLGGNDLNIISEHRYIQIFLTGTDDFNNHFSGRAVILSPETKDELFRNHNNMVKKMMKTAISINSASKKGWIKRKLCNK